MNAPLALKDDPDGIWGNPAMEFRLTYEGRLASGASASAKHKHDIRRVFHRQLKALWGTHPIFGDRGTWGGKFKGAKNPDGSEPQTRIDQLAAYYRRGNYHFVPLVFDEQRLLVSLEVLFLRAGPPGATIAGGDLDNRLKTLFDALKVPEGVVTEPEIEETPFFVLLEDDRLITRVVVESDQLLEPTEINAGPQDARLVITVKLTPYFRLYGTMGY